VDVNIGMSPQNYWDDCIHRDHSGVTSDGDGPLVDHETRGVPRSGLTSECHLRTTGTTVHTRDSSVSPVSTQCTYERLVCLACVLSVREHCTSLTRESLRGGSSSDTKHRPVLTCFICHHKQTIQSQLQQTHIHHVQK